MSENGQAGGGQRAPLLSHLLALRRVLLISLIAVAAAFMLIFFLAINPLMDFITGPISARGIEVIYTALSEAVTTKVKVALIAAVIAASPIVIWQVWGFVRPALYPREKKAFRAVFFIMVALFLLGVSFCYFAVYSLALDFFLVQGEGLATPMLSLDQYVAFLFGFIVPFGAAFQLPLALYLTAKAGLTDAKMLASKRKYVILGVFVLAAVLTPPDIVSQVALGVPLCLLYEAGVLASRLTRRGASA
ncbi:MAG: twin-arginine translocase subunit TatC [Clostridia bacterium]|nr:twin-arginine translocase subunit TatC [Clostridia bacterium]